MARFHRLWSLVLLGCLGCAGAVEKPALFDVPRLDKIVIDGKADDWGRRGFRVDALTWLDGPIRPANDFDPRFRLAWDRRGLLVLVTVADDEPRESDDIASLWQRDCAELFLADRHGGSEKVQCVVAPGLDPKHPRLRHYLYDQRSSKALRKVEPTAQAARTKTRNGYVMEVLLPWSNVGIDPTLGLECAFQAYLNDSDARGGLLHATWYPQVSAHIDSKRMHRIRLASRPSPPVVASAEGHYEDARRVVVQITAAAELAGKIATVRDAGRGLARGRLSEEGGRAYAKLRVPMPPPGRAYGTLAVRVDGRNVAFLDLPDGDAVRARTLLETRLVFRRHVFSGRAFPKCQFERPAQVEELIGPYRIELTCYDSDYRAVTNAEKPGRYGAVVKIRAEDGRTYTRLRTLFRTPEPLEWWGLKLKGTGELPKALGIDPAVAAERKGRINEMLKWALAEQSGRSDRPASVLAGLYEMKPGGKPSFTDSTESRDRQWWVGLKRKLGGNGKRFARPFVCPRPIAGGAAPVLRTGTLAQAGMKPDTDKKLDGLLTEWAANSDQAFIACVARRGVVVLHKAYGSRDGKPMTLRTKSWMASLTKLLHGACMMMLVDQGLVDLDATVEKYLPEFRGVKATTPMTVRHLFTHTAGMWGHWGDETNDLEHLVAEYAPHLEIGKKFEYNGMDLALASKVIEQITGEALPAFYKKHLLDPLGCADTEVTTSSHDARSTAMDMARIGQMLLHGGAYGTRRFFRRDTRDKMLPVKLTALLGPNTLVSWGIGCAWMSTDVLGKRTFGHGAASSATLRIDPENDLVVSMTRDSAGRNFGKYHQRFLRAVVDSIADAKRK